MTDSGLPSLSGQKISAAVVSGIIAGVVMSAFMMVKTFLGGASVWRNANLIAAMWFGPSVAGMGFGVPAMLGMTTHLVTSAVMGAIGLLFIDGLATVRMYLAGFAYALASYPLVLALVMDWADPTFVNNTRLLPMMVAHSIFGITFVASYRWLSRDMEER